jgi:metal-responsive CopG/Arc/MetJ family transcriptional regulator
MKENRVTIKIPRPLYRRISQIIEGSGFRSPTDFIVFVLRDLAGEKGTTESPDEISQDEIRSIRKKLQNLGYIE